MGNTCYLNNLKINIREQRDAPERLIELFDNLENQLSHTDNKNNFY